VTVARRRAALSEFQLIRRFFTHRVRNTPLGVGDDAALVRVRAGHELAVSADMLVEGRHFFPKADPRLLGYKALAVNLSDMAAMGARPRWATLAIALPRVEARWLEAFSRGFMSLARRYQVDLIGGDTTRGPLTICVQIMGEVPNGAALRRDGAKEGDDVWVSGQLGDAAVALRALQGLIRLTLSERRALERRLHAPTPRVELGLALRGIAHSAIDISDGLLADLAHICERSRVGAVVEWEAIPANPIVRSRAQTQAGAQALVGGGDDYELCFTAAARRRSAVLKAAARARVGVTLIGRIEGAARAREAVRVLDSVGKPMSMQARGYDHFR
jgi:thiamine-monophosphate kinase